MKRILSFLLIISYSSQGLAQDIRSEPLLRGRGYGDKSSKYNLLSGDGNTLGGEITAGYFPGAIMIPLQVWGATKKTGLFRVPKNTSLTTLITYAGGPGADSELDNIKIKRTAEDKQKIFRVDVEKLLEDPNRQDVTLQPNDIIYIATKRQIIDPTWLYVLGFVASILGTSAAVISILDK